MNAQTSNYETGMECVHEYKRKVIKMNHIIQAMLPALQEAYRQWCGFWEGSWFYLLVPAAIVAAVSGALGRDFFNNRQFVILPFLLFSALLFGIFHVGLLMEYTADEMAAGGPDAGYFSSRYFCSLRLMRCSALSMDLTWRPISSAIST